MNHGVWLPGDHECPQSCWRLPGGGRALGLQSSPPTSCGQPTLVVTGSSGASCPCSGLSGASSGICVALTPQPQALGWRGRGAPCALAGAPPPPRRPFHLGVFPLGTPCARVRNPGPPRGASTACAPASPSVPCCAPLSVAGRLGDLPQGCDSQGRPAAPRGSALPRRCG